MTGLITDNEEHRLIRESVTKVAVKYGHAYFAERSRRGERIGEMWAELGEAGLLGVHLPEEYGGGGAGLSEFVVVLEELAAHGMPLLAAVISPAICGAILAAHASPELKREWLPAIAAGTRKMAFALTEPDAGSNSHNVSTLARKDGDGWTITGGKYYISAVDDCDAILVVARAADLPGTPGRRPLSLFVVSTRAEGLTLQQIETEVVSPDKQFMLFFDNVRVGPEALIGSEGEGLRQAFSGLNPERILAAALCNGIGRYAVSKARDYAVQRKVWRTPIGTHQGISHPLAESHIAVELARLATARAAELFDSGQNAGEAANMAKFAAAEAGLKALDQAIQTHGGNGLSREYGLADLWFITRLMRIAPVSREMVLNFVAQTSLGLPNSY
ncbi:acyl-CoA dehydrogenase family protein [Amycolatopsis sp.]|jgi:alkylation response protein AidB-like acyl-CoA dehydrogenase|uniref:acyl-CoA dehydrogenase family protein n=1 Tax=Amycolatopsis sp. TaxID=37632 RepID=UPI002DFB678C|nr:acyl-CoA dehydrogenase family protein [Amycolatopsis sp.]